MWCFEACEHDIPYLQLPQVHLVCFRCTTHSDEPSQNKIVSAKASTIWSLISIVQRQQNQT